MFLNIAGKERRPPVSRTLFFKKERRIDVVAIIKFF
jgi:hypothetical protein